MKYASKLFVTITALLLLGAKYSVAQEQERKDSIKIEFNEDAPMLSARETPKRYYIRKVNLHGVTQMSENNLRSIAGLIPGDTIYLPSNFITNSISRLWAMNYFSDVKIGAVMEGDSVDMEIYLKERPRVYSWNFVGEGIGNPKKKDLAEKLKLKRNTELSDYIIDKNEKLLKKEFADKGFRNTEVKTIITNDSTMDNVVHVTFHIDRKDKVDRESYEKDLRELGLSDEQIAQIDALYSMLGIGTKVSDYFCIRKRYTFRVSCTESKPYGISKRCFCKRCKRTTCSSKKVF